MFCFLSSSDRESDLERLLATLVPSGDLIVLGGIHSRQKTDIGSSRLNLALRRD